MGGLGSLPRGPRVSGDAPAALGHVCARGLTVGRIEAIDVEGSAQVVVLVLEDASEPSAGGDPDNVPVGVVAA